MAVEEGTVPMLSDEVVQLPSKGITCSLLQGLFLCQARCGDRKVFFFFSLVLRNTCHMSKLSVKAVWVTFSPERLNECFIFSLTFAVVHNAQPKEWVFSASDKDLSSVRRKSIVADVDAILMLIGTSCHHICAWPLQVDNSYEHTSCRLHTQLVLDI